MSSASDLLKAVQSGAMSLDELSPDRFEDLVVEIVRAEYGSFGESANITRDRRYDVDIVVREQRGGPFRVDDDLHFIEAKCYGKNLSLDTAAKAYCSAIRYRPRTLTIACKSALQPQPLDYGRALFGDGRITRLFILNLRRALSLDALDPVVGEGSDDVRDALFRLRYWQIWRRTTFTAELIATSDSTPRSVVTDLDATYDLIIVADKATGSSQFHLSCDGIEPIAPTLVEEFGEIARIELPLNPQLVARSRGLTELVAIEGVRLTSEIIKLPHFEVEASSIILPDLRADISCHWAGRLLEPDGPRLLLLRGEGGIGKTYLCERIGASLQKEIAMRCAHIAVDSVTSHLTFFRLILSILFPPDIDRSNGVAFEEEAIQSLLRTLEPVGTSASNGDANGLSTGVDLLAQITLAAKLIATRDAPVAIFLSNCQHLTPELLLALRAFLSALDQFGWNKCRVVCEYRDRAATTNAHLREFINTVLTDRIGNAAELEVTSIGEEILASAVSSLFQESESGLVARSLMRKTGGNPFLLENLLQHYRDRRIIERSGSTYRIADHTRFNTPESDIAQSARYILAERLRHLDSVLNAKTGRDNVGSQILGLAALMGPKVDERVWRIAGWEQTTARQVQSVIESHGILTRSLDDGSARFSHELMRVACREHLAEISSGNEIVNTALGYIDGGEPSDFELRGMLHSFLRNEREALREFNRGYELAALGDQNFWMQKRCLAGISELYARRQSLDDHDRLMYVEVLSNLAWAEHNSGSSKYAADIYQRALNVVEHAPLDSEIWTPVIKWERKAALSHALLGLSLPTLNVNKTVEWGRYAIRSVQDFTRLGKILNRVVRLCNLFGYGTAGAEASKLAVTLATESTDPEVLAVLCTDVGDLYLHSEPEASLALRDRGVSEAKARRQQLHNEVCAAISNVYAHSQWSEDELISRLVSDARAVGVRNVSARLSLYRGAKAFAEGALDLSRLFFLEVAQIALLSGDVWLECLANNNLAIISWTEGDYDRADAEAMRVANTVRMIAEGLPSETSFIELVNLARLRGESLGRKAKMSEDHNVLPLLEHAPRCCGSMNVLFQNLEEFGLLDVEGSVYEFWANRRTRVRSSLAVLRSETHPLVVRGHGRTLALALE